ncbi:MAG: hypothetical protein F9K22_01245 [Bacteroidetes bacterium]|nr:MAG: hypothetical protein F9K22_01245 [Bacteroidota bacterium]
METGKRIELDRECTEKGRMWNDYLIHLTNALHVSRIPLSNLLISFDVLIALIHYASERVDHNEYCRFRLASGDPADIESIPYTDKYVFYSSHDRVEVVVDMFAHPETVEFA